MSPLCHTLANPAGPAHTGAFRRRRRVCLQVAAEHLRRFAPPVTGSASRKKRG